jgi:glutamine phosphoribosylpyrophosphate amidotransferase
MVKYFSLLVDTRLAVTQIADGGYPMCGIAGLFLKNPTLQSDLGRLTSLMLRELCDRGPDSAGFAIYGTETGATTKICMVSRSGTIDWATIARQLGQAIGAEVAVDEIEDHSMF